MILRNFSACPCLDSDISCQAAPPLNYFLSPFRSPWTDLLFTLLRLFLLHVDPFLTLPGFWQSWLGYSPLDAFLTHLVLPRFWQPTVSHPLTDTYLPYLVWAPISLTRQTYHMDALLALLRLWCSMPGCLCIGMPSCPTLNHHSSSLPPYLRLSYATQRL